VEAKQNLINMKKYTCPDCGKIFEEGSVPSECPNCGCPSNQFSVSELASQATNISPSLESSNDFGAEHTVNGLAVLSLAIGIIAGIGALIGCIYFFSSGGFEGELLGPLCLIFGLLFIILGILSWAFLKLLVNISYRLTRLDNKYNPK